MKKDLVSAQNPIGICVGFFFQKINLQQKDAANIEENES